MTDPEKMKNLFIDYLLKTDNSPAQFCIRMALGIVIFPHGAQKVLGWFGGSGFGTTLHIFSGLGFPVWSTVLLMITEFIGPVFLITGLLSRVWALALGISMTLCMFMNHVSNGFFMNWFGKQQGEGFEYHLLVLGIVGALLWQGSGAFSLDRFFYGKFHSGLLQHN